jgi:hypothetical protein
LIAVDTNLLVYAHRPEAPFHDAARRCLAELHAARRSWGIPCHCLVEFAAVVSSRRIWQEPSRVEHVRAQVEAWRTSRELHILGDDASVWDRCVLLAASGAAEAARWYDARIAAACLAHGVRELWTIDRDYSRFPELPVRNPL